MEKKRYLIIVVIAISMTVNNGSAGTGYNELELTNEGVYVLCEKIGSYEGICVEDEIREGIDRGITYVISLENQTEYYEIEINIEGIDVRDFTIKERRIWMLTEDRENNNYIVTKDMNKKNTTEVIDINPHVGGYHIEVTETQVITYYDNGSGKYIEIYERNGTVIEFERMIEILPGDEDGPPLSAITVDDGYLWSMHLGREIRSSYGRSTHEDNIFHKINMTSGHREGTVRSNDYAPVDENGRIEDFYIRGTNIILLHSNGKLYEITMDYEATTENMPWEVLTQAVPMMILIMTKKLKRCSVISNM